MPKPLSPSTHAAQALHAGEPVSRGVVPSIHLATTYKRDDRYQLVGPGYTRDENPTYKPAEALLARLEGGEQALLFSSGIAAMANTIQAVLRPGLRLVSTKAMYFGTRVWMQQWCANFGVELRLVDGTDLGEVKQALGGKAALLWVETPSNPTWDVVDIEACAQLAHEAGALLAVDSTVATPVHSQPLSLGADLVMHSATKALNGHSDVLAGALVTRDAKAPWWLEVAKLRHDQGSVPGPFESWLLLRGMRTLFVRVERQSHNALAIATRLEGHPRLEQVLYPGLPSHKGHAIAQRQMRGGFGGLLSIRVKGGAEAAIRLVSRLRCWTPATSLGGTESLIEHRATAEGPATTSPPDLLRLSAGLEDEQDLIDDLLQGLE
jgi:cystathionine gamma-synthase